MAYKLSKDLIGHENDVRCCCSYVDELGDEIIVTGSRDKRIIVWKYTPLGGFEPKKTISSHTSYVNCLCVIPPDPSSGRDGTLLASGSNDKTVLVHSLNLDATEPLKKFEGHEDSVSGLIFHSGVLISVSWDGKVCIWQDIPIFEGAHIPSVFCIAGIDHVDGLFGGLQGTFFLTGGADQAVKLWCWDGGHVKMVKLYAGHTGTVRDIKVHSRDVFFTASNDQTVKQWNTQTGECLLSFLCHDSYIYSLSMFHGPSGNFITSGEDGTAKIWEGGVCAQSLALPAQSVWCVYCLRNGDFVVGASDGKARVFTLDATRQAPEGEVALFEEESLKFKTEAGKKLDAQQFPGPEALNVLGKNHGDTKVINNNNQLEVYQWNADARQWELIGHASGEKVPEEEAPSEGKRLPNGKWLYDGQEYDYVIPTEIEEEFGKVRKLKLPYNKTTDPWVAAQIFLQKHMLPLHQLEQVANHIQKVAGPYVYKASDSQGFQDPFTGKSRYIPGSTTYTQSTGSGTDPFTGGSRYVPGSNPRNFPQLGGGSGYTSDPLTGGSRYVPPDETAPKVTFTQGKKTNEQSTLVKPNSYYPMSSYKTFISPALDYGDKVFAKLTEFNATLVVSDALTESELVDLKVICRELSQTSPSVNFSMGHCRLLARMLHWPRMLLFPVLDLIRLALLHPIGAEMFAKEETLDLMVFITQRNEVGDKNIPVALRCLANFFASPSGALLMVQYRQNIFAVLDVQCECVNRTAQIALSTIVQNYYYSYFTAGRGLDDIFLFLKYTSKILKSDSFDAEAKFRVLVGVGTLLSTSRDMADVLRSNGFRNIIQSMKNPTDSDKLKECAELIVEQL